MMCILWSTARGGRICTQGVHDPVSPNYDYYYNNKIFIYTGYTHSDTYASAWFIKVALSCLIPVKKLPKFNYVKYFFTTPQICGIYNLELKKQFCSYS